MKDVISVNGVSVSYSNVEAINNITLQINEGEFVCIIGPNGGGKTTLLNAVLGFLKPDKGEIKVLGGSVKKAYASITYVPQIALVDRRFPISVIETVMAAFLKSGLHPFKLFSKQEKERAEELLRLVGLENKDKISIAKIGPSDDIPITPKLSL